MVLGIKKGMLYLLMLSLVVVMAPIPANATTFSKTAPKGIMAIAVDNKIAVSWEPVKGATKYRVYEATGSLKFKLVGDTSSRRRVLKNRRRGVTYRYYAKAYKKVSKKYIWSKKSKTRYTTVALRGKTTVKNFLRTSLSPVGSTMYIWGGGWNKADTGAGKAATSIGLCPKWIKFASNKGKNYNYRRYKSNTSNGLDCSGFVGWAMYNTFNTENNKRGFVKKACSEGKLYSKRGYGSWTPKNKVFSNMKAGDIMSGQTHVWICLGKCKGA